jgi:hypothetical protein
MVFPFSFLGFIRFYTTLLHCTYVRQITHLKEKNRRFARFPSHDVHARVALGRTFGKGAADAAQFAPVFWEGREA